MPKRLCSPSDEREASARQSFLLGKLLEEAGALECAAELLGEAIQIDPSLVAARVELGFVLGRDEDYAGMLEAFSEAVRIDARAVRRAVRKEPEELEQLRRILRPDPPASGEEQPAYKSAMPAQFLYGSC
jgi:tetratricopeptide (TPR) repeat protein